MRTHVALVAAILMASPVAGHAATRDVFAGEWAGDCGQEFRCTLSFAPSGKGYQMVLDVAEADKPKASVCKFEAQMGKRAYDVLDGRVDGYKLSAVYLQTSEVVISGLPVDECSGAAVNGRYSWFSDM